MVEVAGSSRAINRLSNQSGSFKTSRQPSSAPLSIWSADHSGSKPAINGCERSSWECASLEDVRKSYESPFTVVRWSTFILIVAPLTIGSLNVALLALLALLARMARKSRPFERNLRRFGSLTAFF
jgi:hypothetical protein